MVQELLLRNTTDYGGIVASTRDGENEMLCGISRDPSRKLIRSILGAISEYDREMTVDRLAAARHAKAAKGGYAHGALPYGFRSVKGKLVPDEQEQAALRCMNTLRTQGKSTRAIASALQDAGYPTKRGGSWTSPVVSRILSRLPICSYGPEDVA
jgi:DNA invertase Pin-like site-specific DNA recombinase